MRFRDKIIPWEHLRAWRIGRSALGQRLVVTNGCFDLLHYGHIVCLAKARALGDGLLVGVNDDEGVRALKGDGRPINPASERAAMLAALESVDAVCVFPGKSATAFLLEACPVIYVKGGDYTLRTLDKTDRKIVESAGARIVFIPLVPGKSTSAILKRQ